MEAFAALGLAANIAQFLELGAKIFKDAKEIKDGGSTVSVSHLATLASDMKSLNGTLRSQYLTLAPQALSGEKELCDLALQCSEAADELGDVLSGIASRNAKRTWGTFVAAMQTMWHRDRIEALADRIGDYRSQLTIRLLVILNQQHRQGLDSVRDEIVEVISVSVRDLMAKIGQGHDEAFAATFRTRGGASTTISRATPTASIDGKLLRTSVTYSQDTGSEGNEAHFRTRSEMSNYSLKIMNALQFRGITERRSTILPVHKDTFEWVWDNSCRPNLEDARWDALGPWLKAENPSKGRCYWVSGKAGSGKSSLLNYCERDTRMASLLQEWAGSSTLVISSFYFWYAGTELQKSHAGLLRSLLLAVLDSRPNLATVLFPDLCGAIVSGALDGRLELSLWELKAAFSNLVQCVPPDMRICFIVDGLDEYTGDCNEICQLLIEVAACTSIKVLVSSRPIPACCDKFRGCPGLRVQDLTRDDIHRYVSENLGNHHLMAKMEKAKPGVTAKIVGEVADRASGVFLWVVIVTKNLIRGLQNYHSSTDLMKEISRLPRDLERLYDHMLGSMNQQDRFLGSKFLQLVLRNTEIAGDHPLTLLQLSFAVEEDYEARLRMPLNALTEADCEWRYEATEGRLRSSCCGLCEVHGSQLYAGDAVVAFIHRTVVEFLQINANWNKITQLTSKSAFDADIALVSSAVYELKARPAKPRRRKQDPSTLMRMLRMLAYEKMITENAKTAFHNKYLPAMRNALAYHWHDPNIFPTPADEVSAVESSYARACQQLKLVYPRSCILSLGIQAAGHRLYLDVYRRLKERIGQQLDAVYFMVHLAGEPDGRIRLLMSKGIKYLPVNATAPLSVPSGPPRKLWNDRWRYAVHRNNPDRPWSLWEFALHYCYSAGNGTEDGGFDFIAPTMSKSLLITLSGLLSCEAPSRISVASATRRLSLTRETRELSPLSVIMPVLGKIWSHAVNYPATERDEVAELSCRIEEGLRKVDNDEETRFSGQELSALAISDHPTRSRLSRVEVDGASSATTQHGVSRESPRAPPEPTVPTPRGSLTELSQSTQASSPWSKYRSRNQRSGALVFETSTVNPPTDGLIVRTTGASDYRRQKQTFLPFSRRGE